MTKFPEYIQYLNPKFSNIKLGNKFGVFDEQYLNENDDLDNQLLRASYVDDLNLVKELISKGADIHSHDDLPLRYSVANKNLVIVRYLLGHGANIHAENDYALHTSAQNGYLEMVKLLVDNGANIHSINDYAIRYASLGHHLEVVKYLVSKYDPKYIIKELPQFTNYITDPNYSHLKLGNKFGVFDNEV